MKYFQKLKTSEKISLSFSLFGFLSLLVFLILINITYFFIWYSDQKEMSFSKMNETYLGYLTSDGKMEDVEHFKNYLLSKDTMIIPDAGELICSPGVSLKIKEDPEQIQNKYFYKDGEIVYFIYTKYFEHIGEVKVFFDTTPYITSQIIIIKIGLLFIFIVSIFQFFIGKYISRRLLKDLKRITEKVKDLNINTTKNYITCDAMMPQDDEIYILAKALNNSYDLIEKQTQNLKQFITDVSHEFKTPLMGMSSQLDLIEKKKEKLGLSETDISSLLENNRKSIHKLNGLLETLFFLSRIEEKSGCLVKKDLELKAYIEKKISEISKSFPEKTLSYNIKIPEKLTCQVEENTFSILLDNLLSNAMKFSPKNVVLEIGASEKMLYIEDNGPGISESEKEKIWDKFFRKDTKIEGFGIGLYLVKRITDIYGWTIQMSCKKGKGARFTIFI